jgi:hypothetical protein
MGWRTKVTSLEANRLARLRPNSMTHKVGGVSLVLIAEANSERKLKMDIIHPKVTASTLL